MSKTNIFLKQFLPSCVNHLEFRTRFDEVIFWFSCPSLCLFQRGGEIPHFFRALPNKRDVFAASLWRCWKRSGTVVCFVMPGTTKCCFNWGLPCRRFLILADSLIPLPADCGMEVAPGALQGGSGEWEGFPLCSSLQFPLNQWGKKRKIPFLLGVRDRSAWNVVNEASVVLWKCWNKGAGKFRNINFPGCYLSAKSWKKKKIKSEFQAFKQK